MESCQAHHQSPTHLLVPRQVEVGDRVEVVDGSEEAMEQAIGDENMPEPVPIACQCPQKEREEPLPILLLPAQNDSLQQLRPKDKLIGYFIESLILQDNSKLPIGSYRIPIFIHPRLLVFSLSLTVLFLPCHLLI